MEQLLERLGKIGIQAVQNNIEMGKQRDKWEDKEFMEQWEKTIEMARMYTAAFNAIKFNTFRFNWKESEALEISGMILDEFQKGNLTKEQTLFAIQCLSKDMEENNG